MIIHFACTKRRRMNRIFWDGRNGFRQKQENKCLRKEMGRCLKKTDVDMAFDGCCLYREVFLDEWLRNIWRLLLIDVLIKAKWFGSIDTVFLYSFRRAILRETGSQTTTYYKKLKPICQKFISRIIIKNTKIFNSSLFLFYFFAIDKRRYLIFFPLNLFK